MKEKKNIFVDLVKIVELSVLTTTLVGMFGFGYFPKETISAIDWIDNQISKSESVYMPEQIYKNISNEYFIRLSITKRIVDTNRDGIADYVLNSMAPSARGGFSNKSSVNEVDQKVYQKAYECYVAGFEK